ncbi:PREDICTED: LEAF RUST 10 DISEASE-RESISTANCE LOCUS RECEPTOR-LIKE PROTEIN KINASE-like 2.3 isoform X2 [Camelina sativa]|nr:PREDICTED: LEAF RUST 10 DISEASE-RESISTANCE LOCUS RECEPTOR-LIKE PROTEIN KINASE-like 2.3 isoform X2 [Camelina sativa]
METTTEFVFPGFKDYQSEIQTEGAATIEPNGILRLTDQKLNVTGTAFYNKPVRLLDHKNLTTKAVRSFSTSFVFSIIHSSPSNGGYGFTFTLSPTPHRLGAESEKYFGLFNRTNDGDPNDHVFAVEFDTLQGFHDGVYNSGNHIGLDFNSVRSDFQESVVYYNFDDQKEGFQLGSGEPIRAILDYDGPTQMMNLTVFPAMLTPRKPLISQHIPKLSEIVQEEMYIGFTAATGRNIFSAHYVMGWTFSSRGDRQAAAPLALSDLPLPQLKEGSLDNQASTRNILIAAGLIVSILMVLGFLAFFIKKRKTSNTRKKLQVLIPLKHYHYNEVKRYTDSFACVVGRGGFGTVYKGNLPDGRKIAVKVLKDSKSNGEDFINEVASMSQTSHVNIVSLVGFCYEGSKRIIVYEFLENGSLDQFISMNAASTAEWRIRLYEIALGVARGLEYLHYGCKTRIVHFDIKPQNVLLDCNLCPKVSDFGLAKLCEKKESIMSLLDTRGTIGYIAPEMFSRAYGSVSHKSDVYSYGMLVLGMIGATNKDRVEKDASNASSIYFPDWIYKDLENGKQCKLLGDEVTNEEEEITKKMILIALWCIQPSPSNRPSMNRVVEMMEGTLDALEVPPKPVLHFPAEPLQDSSTLSEEITVYTEV